MSLLLLVEIVSGLFVVQDYDRSWRYIKIEDDNILHQKIIRDFVAKKTVMIDLRHNAIHDYVIL